MAKEIAPRKSTPVPAAPVSNPYEEYGNEAFSSTIVGQLLKFNKGEWLAGQEEEEVPEGTQLVVNMHSLQCGYIKWADGKPAETILGYKKDGFRPPERNTLGDLDKAEWPELNDRPIDPWQRTDVILMADPKDGQVYTYAPASGGGLDAIKQLSKEYGTWFQMEPDMMPVVELGSTTYKHPQYGKVYKPVFTVVDKRDINDVSFAAEDDEEEQETVARAAKSKAATKPTTAKRNGKTARRY